MVQPKQCHLNNIGSHSRSSVFVIASPNIGSLFRKQFALSRRGHKEAVIGQRELPRGTIGERRAAQNRSLFQDAWVERLKNTATQALRSVLLAPLRLRAFA